MVKEDFYETQGFETRLYFRHAAGRVIQRESDQAVAGAADLLLCHRETITLAAAPKRWQASINAEIASQLRTLLDRDDLWEHVK
jgi:hypothetical protein